MLLLVLQSAYEAASGASQIPVPNALQVLGRGIPARQYYNGAFPSAPDIRETADMLNMLLARRGRVLFTHYVTPAQWYTTTGTSTIALRFQFHTGPLAAKVRIVYVGYPAPARAAIPSSLHWYGTDDVIDSIYTSGLYTAHAADNFFFGSQDIDVTPDTDYQFSANQANAFTLVSVTGFELPRGVLDTVADSPIVDTTAIAQGAPITSATAHEFITAADKLWKRGGHPLLVWTRDISTGLAVTTQTAANFLDASTTPSSSTIGWPVKVPYSGSLDSSNVPISFTVVATVANPAATGTITLRDQAGTIIATLTITNPAGTLTATGNLTDASGSVPTTRLEVYTSVTATHTMFVNMVSVIMKV